MFFYVVLLKKAFNKMIGTPKEAFKKDRGP